MQLTGCWLEERPGDERSAKPWWHHEAGHALVGALMPDYDPVQKISILVVEAGGLTCLRPKTGWIQVFTAALI